MDAETLSRALVAVRWAEDRNQDAPRIVVERALAVAVAAARVVEGMAQGSFPWWCDDLDKHDQCRVCYRRALRWQDIPHAGDCAAMALEDALTALAGGDS